MSRRRYISTEISVDKRVRKLSDSAALFYTWMIPHAEEDATITSDPEELAAIVVPNRSGWTEKKIAACISEIEEQGLIIRVNGTMYFPVASFYKYQSNVSQDRRRNADPEKPCIQGESAQNSTEQHGTAQNSVSSSPSSSPSLSLAEGFDDFWKLYPRKEDKADARKAFAVATTKEDYKVIISALEAQLPVLKQRERKYMPYPTTWLNGERWLDELDSPSAAIEPVYFDASLEAERAAGLL